MPHTHHTECYPQLLVHTLHGNATHPRLLPMFVSNTAPVRFPPFRGMIDYPVYVTVKKFKLSNAVMQTLHYILPLRCRVALKRHCRCVRIAWLCIGRFIPKNNKNCNYRELRNRTTLYWQVFSIRFLQKKITGCPVCPFDSCPICISLRPRELLYRIHYILLAFSGGFRMFVACFTDKVILYWAIIG